ncbi:MAG: hypothetical protein NXY57DRAFT_939006, partial [Lentinula lateritia]
GHASSFSFRRFHRSHYYPRVTHCKTVSRIYALCGTLSCSHALSYAHCRTRSLFRTLFTLSKRTLSYTLFTLSYSYSCFLIDLFSFATISLVR